MTGFAASKVFNPVAGFPASTEEADAAGTGSAIAGVIVPPATAADSHMPKVNAYIEPPFVAARFMTRRAGLCNCSKPF